MANLNSTELKQREHETWSSAATGWRRRHELLRQGAAPVTERMLSLACLSEGHCLLDIASGTGEPALSAARVVGETGRVVGTDLAEEMLMVARDMAAEAGLENIEFHCHDGETLNFNENTFDAATIRWGLMFMPEPEECLGAVHRALKPGARISVACWAALDKNPFLHVLMNTLGNYMELPKPPPGTPGIFSFADPERIRNTLSAVGFQNIELEELAIDVLEVADGRGYWEAISDLAAPVMAMVRQLDESSQAAYIDEVIRIADSMKQGDTLRMPGVTWVAVAQKSE